VRTAREQEPSVAEALMLRAGIEVFLPQIRSRTAAGTLPTTRLEPVFPRHLFARATVRDLLQRLESIPGAKEVACFRGHVAEIPEAELTNFRSLFDPEDAINHPPHCNDPKAAFSLEEDPWLHLRATIEFDFPAARRVRFLCRKTPDSFPGPPGANRDLHPSTPSYQRNRPGTTPPRRTLDGG
jgi:hypothetical protein